MSLIKNLKLRYPGFSLEIDSLEIPDEGITLIQGPSGSGKTSFLKVLMGLEKTQFEWIFQGVDLAKLSPPQRRLGVIFQTVDLFPHLSVEENILFHANARKIPRDVALKNLQRWAEIAHIQKLLKQSAETLSGGEMQRVALLRALIGQPRLLLMDEPFSALDATLKKNLKNLIKEIVKFEKIPCLVVSHDQNDADDFANYVILFENGKVIKTFQT